jgi:hypothetical protein
MGARFAWVAETVPSHLRTAARPPSFDSANPPQNVRDLDRRPCATARGRDTARRQSPRDAAKRMDAAPLYFTVCMVAPPSAEDGLTTSQHRGLHAADMRAAWVGGKSLAVCGCSFVSKSGRLRTIFKIFQLARKPIVKAFHFTHDVPNERQRSAEVVATDGHQLRRHLVGSDALAQGGSLLRSE